MVCHRATITSGQTNLMTGCIVAAYGQFNVIMAALRSRCGHYIFVLWFLLLFLWPPYVIGQAIYIFTLTFVLLSFFFFFPRLISAVADWMSTILSHMVWH